MNELEIPSSLKLEDLKMRLRVGATHGTNFESLFVRHGKKFAIRKDKGLSRRFELLFRNGNRIGSIKYRTVFYGELVEEPQFSGIRGKFKIWRFNIFWAFLRITNPFISFGFFSLYFFVTGILVFLWYGPHGNILKLLFCPVLTVILAMMSMFTWSNDVKPRLNTFLDELTNEGQTLNKEDMEAMMAYLKACCEG